MELFELFGRVVVEVEKAIENLKQTSDAARETGESVGDVGDKSKESGETASKSFKSLPDIFSKANITVGAFVAGIVALGKKILEVADSTREYRTEMGKLQTAFTTVGHSATTATNTYRQFVAVLGETDQAVEAANHLAVMCDSTEQLEMMTEACIGVFARFGSSLPLEGLTEAANETAKTGVVVGQLADALNWAGVSEDSFNTKLAACNSERERAALITDTLIDLYGDSAKAYKSTNKEILDANTAQDKLNDAMAHWGEIFEPIANEWREFSASFLDFAAYGAEYFSDPVEQGQRMAGTFETSAEALERIQEIKEEIAAIEETPVIAWTEMDSHRWLTLKSELETVEGMYNDLAEAERAAAEAAGDAADPEIVARFDEATTQYVTDMTMLLDSFVQTYESIYNAVSGWFDPFEEATVTVTTSVGEMMAAMQSQIDFNTSYAANLETLREYGLGGLADSFMECGAAGAAYADTIVQAVEAAGGATTEEGQAIIQGFTDLNQQITDSQGELAQTMTLLDGEFETQMQSIVDTYGEAVEGLDKSAEAADAATSTFQAFYDAMNKEIPGIVSAVSGFGDDITRAIKEGIGTIHIPINLVVAPNKIPGAKHGLDYVPYDEYLVRLHKGEAVLTAEEATAWRAGKESASAPESGGTDSAGSSGITIVQNINAVEQTPVELASATAAYFEQARWAV